MISSSSMITILMSLPIFYILAGDCIIYSDPQAGQCALIFFRSYIYIPADPFCPHFNIADALSLRNTVLNKTAPVILKRQVYFIVYNAGHVYRNMSCVCMFQGVV